MFPSKEERIAACERRDITLNGNPAKISGYNQPFATVTDMVTRLSAEWSWEAVIRIVNSHKRFES